MTARQECRFFLREKKADAGLPAQVDKDTPE